MSDEEFELVTKKNGQVVKVYPDGRKYLVSPNDLVLQHAVDGLDSQIQADSELQQVQIDEIAKKKSELVSGGLPSEKSPI